MTLFFCFAQRACICVQRTVDELGGRKTFLNTPAKKNNLELTVFKGFMGEHGKGDKLKETRIGQSQQTTSGLSAMALSNDTTFERLNFLLSSIDVL